MRTSEAYLERFLGLHPKLIDLSLGRTERLLAKLGNPEARLPPVIHVAGTNGKGSTIAFLRAMLEAAGKRVHVYTSPHLVRFHERIRLAGTLVSEAELVGAFERVEAANAVSPSPSSRSRPPWPSTSSPACRPMWFCWKWARRALRFHECDRQAGGEHHHADLHGSPRVSGRYGGENRL